MESHAQSIQRLDMNEEYLENVLKGLQDQIDSVRYLSESVESIKRSLDNLRERQDYQNQQIELIKRTLRTVCIDTENPIHF